MATARGITETKVYDYDAVVERYGIPPELIPDFYGLKGDTSDNIPGVPGIGDKTASQLLQQFGTLEEVLANIDQISGAKRKENLVNHAEDARVSKELATAQRDIDCGFDLSEEVVREPDRSKLREVFREFELRDPLRRLEEALGDPDAAAPAPPAEEQIGARLRQGTLADVAALPPESVALYVHEPEVPEGELMARDDGWRFAVARDGEVLVGSCSDPSELVSAVGGPARHRPRREGARHDPAGDRARHPARGVSARAGATRVPVPRAGRGARAGRGRRRPDGVRRRPGGRARRSGSAIRSASGASSA